MTTDKETGNRHLRHRVDMTTGTYRGKKIFDSATKVSNLSAGEAGKVLKAVEAAHTHDHAHGHTHDHGHDHGRDQKMKAQSAPKVRAARRTATSASKGG
jgi:hypothetical protein